MVKVCIERQLLPVADALIDIFTMRMAEISIKEGLTDKPSGEVVTSSANANSQIPQGYDVFVCSAEFANKNGDTPGIVDLARSMKAKKLMVIGHDEKDQFFVSHEMNGKLIRLNMPKSAQAKPTAENYSLQMAVTLCLDNDHVAVADASSRQLMVLAKRVALTDVTVFINGPTGTGKEVLAKFIHNQSNRRDKAFVAVNCAAIPENMLEAILFGHEKGAFTGASSANKGIFRAADGGTLLLDEISEMPLSLQAKLLRALQERKVTPLGSQREIDVDVRVIATTNREMLSEISNGKFREDLYYRLNVFPLTTQQLEQRTDDIIPITSILLARHCMVLDDLPSIDDEAVEILLSYNWPGNVRELENVLQRAIVLSSGGRIMGGDIMVDGFIQERIVKNITTEMALAKSSSA
ncbi:sigma-54 dependent transcriptional regulator [Alphaproteobacteria bacterium]|jgi:two-component system response regulator FlrC|nr:sigma-54 dependent transcriptional regulator [Alphaproteobacteria bacterium]